MFARFMKPTTFNITYTGPHVNFSPSALGTVGNQVKLLYLDDTGVLQWLGFDTAFGIPRLDAGGKILASQIPIEFDDFMQYAGGIATFPATGADDKYYVDQITNIIYRWSGISYIAFNDLSNYYNRTQIDTFFNDETAVREFAEATLQDAIDSEATTRSNADTTLQTNITAEATARGNADSTLTTNLNSEITNRTNADSTLTTNLNSEITNRTNADTTLQTNITAEATARANADTTLTTNLNTEISDRISGVNGVQANVTAESATRLANDNTLQTNITAEASTRATNDTTNANAIASEITNRTAADTAHSSTNHPYTNQANTFSGTQTMTRLDCNTFFSTIAGLSTTSIQMFGSVAGYMEFYRWLRLAGNSIYMGDGTPDDSGGGGGNLYMEGGNIQMNNGIIFDTARIKTTDISTNTINLLDDTPVASLNATYADWNGLRVGRGDATRETAAGCMYYKPAFANTTLSIIGASASALDNAARIIKLWDVVQVNYSLSVPHLSVTAGLDMGANDIGNCTTVNATTLNGTTGNIGTVLSDTYQASDAEPIFASSAGYMQIQRWMRFSGNHLFMGTGTGTTGGGAIDMQGGALTMNGGALTMNGGALNMNGGTITTGNGALAMGSGNITTTGSIAGVPYLDICTPLVVTFTSTGGSQTFTYNPSVGIKLRSAMWTERTGNTVIPCSHFTDEYVDAIATIGVGVIVSLHLVVSRV